MKSKSLALPSPLLFPLPSMPLFHSLERSPPPHTHPPWLKFFHIYPSIIVIFMLLLSLQKFLQSTILIFILEFAFPSPEARVWSAVLRVQNECFGALTPNSQRKESDRLSLHPWSNLLRQEGGVTWNEA